MSDDLVKQARDFCVHTPLSKTMITKLADRIEQLVAINEELQAKLAECEARLEKAVGALESVISCSNDVRLVHDAEATLEEIKGQNDD